MAQQSMRIPRLPQVTRLSPGVYRRQTDGALIPGPNATPIRQRPMATTQPVKTAAPGQLPDIGFGPGGTTAPTGGLEPGPTTAAPPVAGAPTQIPRVKVIQGVRVSPGVYRNPQTGKTFNSVDGKIKVKMGGGKNMPANPDMPAAPLPANPATPAAPVINEVPSITTAGPDPAPTMSTGLEETLFPSARIFEPQNYEGSPLYKFQVEQGQKQLARSLASRGLTDSGKAIEDELNIPLRAAAQDTDRMTRLASENADRLKSFQDNEALRLERTGNNQWQRLYDITSLMAQQSPWAGALAGLNNSAELGKAAGEANANYLRDAYGRVIATPSAGGGGGGRSGGGSATPPATVPVPSGPDFSNIAPTSIGGDYSSNKGWLNLLTQGLGALFGGEEKPKEQTYKLVAA